MTATVPLIRDGLLIATALAVLLWLGQGWVEKNLIEKSVLVQRVQACETTLAAVPKK